MNESTPYWMWIQQAVGQGSSAVPKLLEAFSSPEEVYAADRLALEHAGITGKALDCLCRKNIDPMKRMAQRCAKLGWILTPDDFGYPDLLRQIFSPPLALYGKGLLPDLNKVSIPPIAVVGTRKATAYGQKAAGGIAAGLAAVGSVVISGGAKGIDRAVHEGALYGGGRTIVVQACGVDVEYPRVNYDMRRRVLEANGAIITEYLPGVRAYADHFQVRNRLISGMAWGVCVVEAPERSGALITARFAREQDRDLFVVPGNITSLESRGSNALIQDGAQLVTRPGEILGEYHMRVGHILPTDEADRAQEAYDRFEVQGGMRQASRVQHVADAAPEPSIMPCPETASADAKAIYTKLTDTPITADELCAITGIAPGKLFVAMTELELYGCAYSHPGNRYSRRKPNP